MLPSFREGFFCPQPSILSTSLNEVWAPHGVWAAAMEGSRLVQDGTQIPARYVRTRTRLFRATHSSQRYLFKHLPQVDAHRVEWVTALANLFGLETPPAVTVSLCAEGHDLGAEGVLIPWLEQREVAHDYDFSKATPKVHEYTLLSRWFNELVGNQDCWFGQFLRPDGEGQYRELINIDFDNAFGRREAAWYQRELWERCGLDRKRSDCVDRPFRFAERVGWKPRQYDCVLRFYGPFLRAYLYSEIDWPHDALTQAFQRASEVDDERLTRLLTPFLTSASAQYLGMVPVQGARRYLLPQDFQRRFLRRVRRSFEEFHDFLHRCAKERAHGTGPMMRFYASMPAPQMSALGPFA
jgi:hypothetical protein